MAEEDILFGKNRHLFGGVEPSNMAEFTVGASGNTVKLNAQLPADTVIDKQTLCTVAGAVIRRKLTDYPRDEFDGDLVADIKMSTTFVDSSADVNGTYYYAAFPYTTQGVYNRNPANRIVFNEPPDMVVFTATNKFDTQTQTCSVVITAELPEGVSGAVIRKSTIAYPIDETDGSELVNITEDTVFTDTNVEEGATYYYSAFTYTSTGAYNRNDTNRSAITVKRCEYLFGYDIDLDDSNPSIRVSYPSDVDNADYTPAYMDYDADSFNYGSWSINPGEKFMPRPCIISKNGGDVLEYLNPNDYTKTVDGTSSKIKNDAYNSLMEWPKIWTKRWEENGVYHFRCSDVQLDSDYECWCNYDKNDNQIDHFYTAIYMSATAVGSNNEIASYSGTNSPTRTYWKNHREYCTNAGDDFDIGCLSDWLLIQDLLVLMAKTTDCQTAYGNGYFHSDSLFNNRGGLDGRGLFWGSNTSDNQVKVFGMEDWWGNGYKFITGYVCDANNTLLVKFTRGQKDGSTVGDYNDKGTGYINTGVVCDTNGSYQYISATLTLAAGRIPTAFSGSSSTYETDSACIPKNGMYARVAKVGGFVTGGKGCGPFNVNLEDYNSTSDYSFISYKPTKS